MVALAGPARGAERWPANVCADLHRDVQRFEDINRKFGAIDEMVPLWAMEEHRCGVDVREKMAEARRVAEQKDAAPAAGRPAQPKKPLDCMTIKLDRDLATTHCD